MQIFGILDTGCQTWWIVAPLCLPRVIVHITLSELCFEGSPTQTHFIQGHGFSVENKGIVEKMDHQSCDIRFI